MSAFCVSASLILNDEQGANLLTQQVENTLKREIKRGGVRSKSVTGNQQEGLLKAV